MVLWSFVNGALNGSAATVKRLGVFAVVMLRDEKLKSAAGMVEHRLSFLKRF